MKAIHLAVLGLLLFVPGCGTDTPADPEATRQRTDPAVGHEEETLARLRAAVEANPDDPAAHRELGHTLKLLNRRQDALEHFEKAAELQPTSTRSQMELALAYTSVARLDEAKAIYEILLRAPTVRHIALHNLGNIELRLEHLEPAMEYYRQALALEPGYVLAKYHLGIALQQAGKFKEAYQVFSELLQTEPPEDRAALASYFDALYRMATLDLSMGFPQRSAELLRELLEAYPAHPNAQYAYGRALLALGKVEEAREALNKHVQTPDRTSGDLGWMGSPFDDQDSAGSVPPLFFEDVTATSGIDYVNVCGAPPGQKGWITETLGAGAGWLDYDGDGILDLYVVNGSDYQRWPDDGEPNQLYRGDGRGGFVDVTAKAGVGHRGWGLGVTVGDYDSDGDPDIFVTNYGPDVLYRNNGDGTFTDVSRAAGVADDELGASAAWFDLEGDGDLDLYVTNYLECDPKRVPRRGQSQDCLFKGLDVVCGPLGQVPVQDVLYRNNGDGTFTDATRETGVWMDEARFGLGVVTGDYDNDGKQDIFVANDSSPNFLWKNQGNGTFVDVAVTSLAALNVDGRAQSGMGTEMGDYNGDGWLDIVLTTFSHDIDTIFRNVQGRIFSDDSSFVGMAVTGMTLSWGTGFYDFDSDGDLDLFIANGHIYPEVDEVDLGTTYAQKNHVFINLGNGRFTESHATSGPAFQVARSFRGTAFGDYDNDGDVDAFVTSMDDRPLLMNNRTTVGGQYLEIQLVGTRSNRDGLGARVLVTAGGRVQMRERHSGGSYLSSNDPRLHFGLGRADWVEKIEVRWPSGTRDVLTRVQANRLITITEGSSPG